MAATTLPLSFQRTHNVPSASTSYDEFGFQSNSAVGPSATSWDEQVVPALRKKLEAESKYLEHRIESSRGPPSQSKQQIKPVRRPDRAHEVLQDGLGSDDLIASGWATGSSAQFAAIAPRAKIHTEDRLRSASAHHQTYKGHDDFSKTNYYQPQAESPPSTFIRDSPSPSRGTSPHNVSLAREKARRLAKEREMPGYGQRLSPSDVDLKYEWLGEEARQDIGERDIQRVRTISSPALQKIVNNESGIPSVPSVLTSNTSKTNSHEKSAARAQIPASKSLPRSQDENTVHSDVRKTKSAARLNARKAPNTPDDSSRYFSKSKASPLRPLQNNTMPDQDILAEFGPLGGTPTKRGRWGEDVEEDKVRRSNQRSVSNAWDDEMIPTVKKRLEQQKMMEGLSRDDEVVDIWDRHGLPLSKRQVSVKHRASEGMSPSKSMHEQDKSVDEGSEKMRRLHEQLDLGELKQESSVSYKGQPEENKEEEDRQQAESRNHIEMQEINRPTEQQRQKYIQQPSQEEYHQYQQYPIQSPPQEQQQQQQHQQQQPREPQTPSVMPPHQTADRIPVQREPILAEVDAGCCKCTVM